MGKKFVKIFLLQFDYWLFSMALFLTALLWSQPTLLSLFLFILLFLVLRNKDKHVVVFALITGALGVSAELIAIYCGAWQYSLPQWLGVPGWLFFLWALAGMFFRQFQMDLQYFFKK